MSGVLYRYVDRCVNPQVPRAVGLVLFIVSVKKKCMISEWLDFVLGIYGLKYWKC